VSCCSIKRNFLRHQAFLGGLVGQASYRGELLADRQALPRMTSTLKIAAPEIYRASTILGHRVEVLGTRILSITISGEFIRLLEVAFAFRCG
jgi:hypothetical protein